MTNFSCPTTLRLWVEKILLVKKPQNGHGKFILTTKYAKPNFPYYLFHKNFFQQKIQKVSKKAHFGPFFTNKIFSTHKSKVVRHQKLVNIGPSDQSFISGKVVFITNNPAEESQVISFWCPFHWSSGRTISTQWYIHNKLEKRKYLYLKTHNLESQYYCSK